MQNSIVEDAPPAQAKSEWRLKTHSSGVPLRPIKEVKSDSAKLRQKGTCASDRQV